MRLLNFTAASFLIVALGTLACKGGAGDSATADGDTGIATETDTAETTTEQASVSGAVDEEAMFVPGVPSVPVAGTNLMLLAGLNVNVYSLSEEGEWVFHSAATVDGNQLTASAPLDEYVMLASADLAVILPPPTKDAELGLVMDQTSTIGSVLFQLAVDGGGKDLIEAHQLDYGSMQEMATLVGLAARRAKAAPTEARLTELADLFVISNTKLIAALIKEGFSPDEISAAFVTDVLAEMSPAATVSKFNKGTYDPRLLGLALEKLPPKAKVQPTAREVLSTLTSTKHLGAYRDVVREHVFAKSMDAARKDLKGKSNATVQRAETALWSSVLNMSDADLVTAANKAGPSEDQATHDVLTALASNDEAAFQAFFDDFCATVTCTASDLGGDDSADDDGGTSTDTGGDESVPPPDNISINLVGNDLVLEWTESSQPNTTYLVVRRAGAAPNVTPTATHIYKAGDAIVSGGSSSTVVFAGPGGSFTDSDVEPNLTFYYEVFTATADYRYSLASVATGGIAQAASITSDPSSASNIGSASNSPWTGETNVYRTDGSFAAIFLDNSLLLGTSRPLFVGGFDFSALPDGANIRGIVVQIRRWETGMYGSDHVADQSIQLYKNLAAVGSQKANANPWNVNAMTVTYGGSDNLWDTTWSKQDLIDPGFGVAIAVQRALGTDAQEGRIDHISVSVHYTP